MKVFQIQDDWGMEHLQLAVRPDPRPGPGQVRLQGITVGNRDGFEAMLRAIGQHRLVPVTDKVFAFEELKVAMAYLKSGAHFGKVCIRH